MLNHLIDPDISTKKQELEWEITECKDFINNTQNRVDDLENQIEEATAELKGLVEKLSALEPDPDYLREG